MNTGFNTTALEPWQWCWQCGQSLFDWSTCYESTSFLGRLVICRRCASTLKDVKPLTTRTGVVGYRDRETWRRVNRRNTS